MVVFVLAMQLFCLQFADVAIKLCSVKKGEGCTWYFQSK